MTPVAHLPSSVRTGGGTARSRRASAPDPASAEGLPPVTTLRGDTPAGVASAPRLGRQLDHVGCHASRSMRPRICRKKVGVKGSPATP